jgi:hypothetical protein
MYFMWTAGPGRREGSSRSAKTPILLTDDIVPPPALVRTGLEALNGAKVRIFATSLLEAISSALP